jgi:hypothetical protein
MKTTREKIVLFVLLFTFLWLSQAIAQERRPVSDKFPLKGTMFRSCEISESYQKDCSGLLDFDEDNGIYSVCGVAVAFNEDQTEMMKSLVGKRVKVSGTVYISIGPSECTGLHIIDVRPGKGSIVKME